MNGSSTLSLLLPPISPPFFSRQFNPLSLLHSSPFISTTYIFRATTRRFLPITKAKPISSMAADEEHVGSLKQQLAKLFEASLKITVPDESDVEPLIAACNPRFGDYQCNNAMSLWTKIKGKGTEFRGPQPVGQALKNNLPASEMVESCSIAGPGFVNIVLSKKWIEKNITKMGGENQSYDDIELKENDGSVTSRHVQWVFMENGNGVCSDSESIESTNLDEDSSSLLSSSASEVMVEEEDDASSSSSTSSSSSSPTSSGPLYDLSELMDQLPIKRGLSNYYQGKSQSFTSLASVKSLEDLAKKASPYRKRMKPCKKYFSPKAIITKKSFSSSRGSSFVSSLGKNRATFVGTTTANSCRPSISVVQKQF